MKALVLTSNGMKQGKITNVTTSFEDGKAIATVNVGGKEQNFTPDQIFSVEGIGKSENVPSYPCVLVGRIEYKTIANYRPKTRKPRTRKAPK